RPLLFRSEMPVTLFVNPSALIISTRAMELLDDEEIEALSAHELVHPIAQPVFRKAVDERDQRVMRLVELFCDAGGAALISSKGGNPRKLYSGLSKLNQVMELEFQEYQRGTDHPTLKARKQLNDALVGAFGQTVKEAKIAGN